jgi:hypothetical protein
MEKRILELIEEEVARRVQLQLADALSVISRLYEIPMERLVKDTVGLECTFCKGLLRSNKRCLKVPRENGYCGFHQKQAPVQKQVPEPVQEAEPPPPWEA